MDKDKFTAYVAYANSAGQFTVINFDGAVRNPYDETGSITVEPSFPVEEVKSEKQKGTIQ